MKTKLLKLFVINIVIFTISILTSNAQIPGTLDLPFGNNGITLSDYTNNGNSNYSQASALQPDGKIVLGGYSINNSVRNKTFMRYYSNGTLDDNFGTGGIKVLLYGGSDDQIWDIIVQPDGKIVSVGYTTNSTNTRIALARLNADGSLDTGFNGSGMKIIDFGSSTDAFGRSIALQDDGKIVVAGYIMDENYNFDATICRLNANGTMDNSFDTNGIVIHDILSQMNFTNNVGIQDEKIIIGGMSYDDNYFGHVTLCRYNSDGSLDTGFGTSGIVSVHIDESSIAGPEGDMCFSNNGKIIYGCGISDSPDNDLAVLRFNPNGSVDNTFGNYGMVVNIMDGNSSAYAVVVQDDNKIIAGGYQKNANSYDFALVRFLENGFPDNGFGIMGNGVVITHASNGNAFYDDIIYNLILQDDGKVIASGYANTVQTDADFAVARYYTGYYVGLEKPVNDEWKFSIAPNPFTNKIKMVFKVQETTIVKAEMFNSSGTKVASPINELCQPGEHQLSWDAINHAPGIYFLKIMVGDKMYLEKVIKMKN